MICGWGWAQIKNISKQKNFLPNPLQNKNISSTQPSEYRGGGNTPHPTTILLDNIAR